MPRVSTKTSSRKKAVRRVKRAPVKRGRSTAVKAARKTGTNNAPVPKQVTTAIREPYTKAQLLSALADNTGVAKRDVAAVFDELAAIIERHIKKRAAGTFTLPGLMKIRTTRKPATRARKGRNPFTGEEIMIAAKPARTAVKVLPLKALKQMVE